MQSLMSENARLKREVQQHAFETEALKTELNRLKETCKEREEGEAAEAAKSSVAHTQLAHR